MFKNEPHFLTDLMLLFRATPRLPAAPGGRSGSCSSTGTAGHVGAPLQEPGGQTGSPAWCPRGRVFGGGYPPRLPACRRGPHLEGGVSMSRVCQCVSMRINAYQ